MSRGFENPIADLSMKLFGWLFKILFKMTIGLVIFLITKSMGLFGKQMKNINFGELFGKLTSKVKK